MKNILYAAGSIGHIKSFHIPYIEALRKEGNRVTVMARGEGADIDMPFVKRLFSPKNLLCAIRARRIIKREKFDTVILNTTLAAFCIRLFLPMRHRPLVINIVHGYMFSPRPRGLRERLFLLSEILLRGRCDHVMVMNAEDLESAEKYKLYTSSATLIRGFGASVPPEHMSRAELRQKYLGNKEGFVITFVGELCALKDQSLLIRALAIVKRNIPEAVLWLVGDGESGAELVRLADANGVLDSVIFMGRREGACDFIRAADLYVSASRKEGLPFNIIEALGCSRTVIASDIKGHRDIIEDGVSGFLFKVGDAEALASLILSVYRGAIAPSPQAIADRYKLFSFDTVFPDTSAKLVSLITKPAPTS